MSSFFRLTMQEDWKPIEGYEGIYDVSSLGRVVSLERTIDRDGKPVRVARRILKSPPGKVGYAVVALWKDGKGKSCAVHRLVAEAFLPKPEGTFIVDHISTDRLDNRVSNLRWVSYSGNSVNTAQVPRAGNANRGIYFDKRCTRRPWRVHCAGRDVGCFSTLEEARSVRDKVFKDTATKTLGQ